MSEKLYNIDYLKYLCKKYKLVPSKKYGQNFLINSEVVVKMSEAGSVNEKDLIVEVGAGFGVLTLELVKKAGKVISFEIEKKLESYWKDRLENNKNLEIVWGNVLRESEKLKIKNYKVIANLPYQITSKVIRNFLESKDKPNLMVFMVQKEVAERMCATKGSMSVLAVSVQYFSEPEIISIVEKNNFWPEPKVDSAIVKLSVKKEFDDKKFQELFFKVVKTGFAQKRKLLSKNLIGTFEKEVIKKAFEKLCFKEMVRAQELDVDEWKKLALILKN